MLHIIFRVAIALFTPTGDADVEDLQRATTTLSLSYAAHELPDVDHPELIDPFIAVAIDVQTPRVPAALLVALAWGESRFDSSAKPACGVMQVYPRDLGEPASTCAEWRRDLRAGMTAGVREIETMLADKRVHGNLRLALLYRACGNSAFDGSCKAAKYAWVTAAWARWRAIASHQLPKASS